MDEKDKAMWVNTLWDPLDEMHQNPLNQKDKEIKVAAYCRVSSGQTNFMSLENQVTYYSRYIHNQPHWKLVGIYIDDRLSGATIKNRPGIKRLLRHANEGRIDLILTKSISRFSRNTKEILEVVDEFKKTNTTIVFENERLEVVNGQRSLMLETQAAMAQDFIEGLSSLVKFSYNKNLMKGRPYFGNIYGYDPISENTKHMVKINEREARVVQWIFNEFLKGVSYAEISRQLNLAGIETKKGNSKWNNGTIRSILRRVEYTGNKLAMKKSKDMFTGKTKENDPSQQQYLIENSHAPIITNEVFDRAQERIAEISFKHNKPFEKVENPIKGRVRCGSCGSSVNRAGKYRFICSRRKADVNTCDSEKLYAFDPQRMILRALFERMMGIEVDVRKDRKGIHYDIHCNELGSVNDLEKEFKIMKGKLEKIIAVASNNEHFELTRLRYFNQLEIAKIQGDDEEHQRIKEEYDVFDKKANEIEEDREWRMKALEWLKSIRTLDCFIMKSSVEILRAWAFHMEVFSRTAYKIRWVDEKTTTIGEDEIPMIMKAVEEKKEVQDKNFMRHEMFTVDNISDLHFDDVSAESFNNSKKKVIAYSGDTGRGDKSLKASNDIFNNNAYSKSTEVIKADVVKLENGLNIKDLENLKQNILKVQYNQLNKDKKLRVAAYCRVSTHMEEQKTSLQTQLAYYNYKIMATSNWELAGIYVDEGLSGKKTENRDSFNRMINDACRGKIDMIITKSVSRFSRNVLDVLETTKLLNELEPAVPVYFEKEKIYSDDKNTGMLLTLMAISAQEQIYSLSNSISWGLQNLAKRGIITRRTSMYGYIIDEDGTWNIVEEEARAIKEIYQLYLGGSEIRDIILYLNNKKIKSPKGMDLWDPNTIKMILLNEKYRGDYEYQRKYTVDTMTGKRRLNRGHAPKYYIEDHHTPIIDKTIFEAVQNRIKEKRREPVLDARKGGTAGRRVYYKKIYCKDCGSVVSRYGSSDYDSREGSQWRCYDSYRVVTSNCKAKKFKEKYLDYNFLKTLEEIKRSKTFRQLIKKSISQLALSPSELKDKEVIEAQIEELNQQLYTAVDMEVQKDGQDTNLINDITEKIIKLREKELLYIERLEKLEDEQERLSNLVKHCENLQSTSFRKFHNMRPRIQHGESLYLVTNAAKNSTYMDLNGEDYFPEEVFAEHVLSATINLEGRIKCKFAENIEFGIEMTYEEYQRQFEREKSKIQHKELIHSEEILKLKAFCNVPRKIIEIKKRLGISSDTSFYKRIQKPLMKAGLIEAVFIGSSANSKYRWVDSSEI